jgi:hypothetical protein
MVAIKNMITNNKGKKRKGFDVKVGLDQNESVADLTARNFNDTASSIIVATFDS